MGGNAFENTKRLSEEEYRRVCARISDILKTENVSFEFPVEIEDKAELSASLGCEEPYGDVDVLVGLEGQEEAPTVVKIVLEKLGGESQNVVQHDTTYSFLTRERYQVDFKFCPRENLQFLLAFKSNNDFGGLVGHLLSSLAIRWNEMGLLLKVKVFNVPEIGTVKKEIVLTKDSEEVCNFLGLPKFCLDGKTSMSSKQIFQIVTASHIFDSELYDEAFKKRHKVEKRPLGREFFRLLENYCDKLGAKSYKQENIFNKFRKNGISFTEYYSEICEHFKKVEELMKIYEDCKRQKNTVEQYKSKFSFDILLKSYPEMNKELAGNILRSLKHKMNVQDSDGYAKWVTETDLMQISEKVERIRGEIGKIQ